MLPYFTELLEKIERRWDEEMFVDLKLIEEIQTICEHYYSTSQLIMATLEQVPVHDKQNSIEPGIIESGNMRRIMPLWIKGNKATISNLQDALNCNEISQIASCCLQLWSLTFDINWKQ